MSKAGAVAVLGATGVIGYLAYRSLNSDSKQLAGMGGDIPQGTILGIAPARENSTTNGTPTTNIFDFGTGKKETLLSESSPSSSGSSSSRTLGSSVKNNPDASIGGYTDAKTGSAVYTQNGKIIGVEDNVNKVSRLPTKKEQQTNTVTSKPSAVSIYKLITPALFSNPLNIIRKPSSGSFWGKRK